MIHENQQASRNAKRDMNLALDHLLPESERATLQAHLARSPGDAALWHTMQMVDDLLTNAPEVQAPPDFASKVMAAIAAAPAEVKAPAKQHTGTSTAFGLALAAVIAGPLLMAGFLGVRDWATDPAALNMLLQQVVLLLNTVTQAIATVFQVISNYVNDNPIVPALLTTIIPLVMIWGWLMWYTSQRRQQIVYRIPVSAA